MSAIPLSRASEGETQGIRTLSGDDRKPDPIDSDDVLDRSITEALDAHYVENITETITNRDKVKDTSNEPLPSIEGEGWAALALDPDREKPAPRDAKLDGLMRAPEAQLAAREIRTRQFHNAKPHFEECDRMGISPDALLKGFAEWDEHFNRAGPQAAAYALAESAFRMKPHEIDVTTPRVDRDKELEKEYPDPLDRAIVKGMEAKKNTERWNKVIEAWKPIEAKYPHERLDDVMRRSVLILKDLARDPWQASARIAAAKGMPVTPPAQAAAEAEYQAEAQVAATIEHGKTYMPNMADQSYRHEMGRTIAQPDFVPSGDDATDLQRAYQIVEIKRQQPDNVRAMIDHFGPANPAYEHVRPYVEAVLRSPKLQFTYNTDTDAAQVWQMAVTAMQNHGKQQRQKLSTLDGRISHAMAQHGVG